MAQIHPLPTPGDSPLENSQREAFAQAIARGETPPEAYRLAFGGDGRGRAARARQQLSLPEILARVRYLQPDLELVSNTADIASATATPAATADEVDEADEPAAPSSDRPVIYTSRIARQFCARFVETLRPLRAICREPGMPELRTVLRWLDTEPKFRTQYNRARGFQAELIADEILEIADDTFGDIKLDANGNPRVDNEAIQRSKLRVETRKWLVAKLLPKKFGDKAEGVTAAATAAASSGDGKEDILKYRLTEERRLAIIERRRQALLANRNRR